MSRNFELLQNLGREPKLFSSATFPAREVTERPAPKLFANDFGVDPAIDQLCQRLFVGGAHAAETRVVTFCSVQPAVSEGEICARAAMTLAARVNRSVCIVDSNLSLPSLHKFFGVPNQSGFGEAAMSDSTLSSHARQIGGSNLSLITAGGAMPDSQGTQSESTAFRLRELRSHFDYVLINGPTVPDRGQGIFLGRLSDGIVLILEANSTRRDTAMRVRFEMEQADVPVLGAVLNNRTFPIPDAVYSKLF
jgi:Mrp family chromosome partitioning ATPase